MNERNHEILEKLLIKMIWWCCKDVEGGSNQRKLSSSIGLAAALPFLNRTIAASFSFPHCSALGGGTHSTPGFKPAHHAHLSSII